MRCSCGLSLIFEPMDFNVGLQFDYGFAFYEACRICGVHSLLIKKRMTASKLAVYRVMKHVSVSISVLYSVLFRRASILSLNGLIKVMPRPLNSVSTTFGALTVLAGTLPRIFRCTDLFQTRWK